MSWFEVLADGHHRDEVDPRNKEYSKETLIRYRWMVFSLIPCRRERREAEENTPGSQQYSYQTGRASPPRMSGRFIMTRTKVWIKTTDLGSFYIHFFKKDMSMSVLFEKH